MCLNSKYIITLLEFESKAEMTDYLECNSNIDNLFLGRSSIVGRGFFVFQLILNNEVILNVGVMTDTCFKPQCKIIDNTILIGFNKEVDCIFNNEIVKRYVYDSLFWKFIDNEYMTDVFLALFELQLVSIYPNCNLKWEHTTHEIIVDYNTVDDLIILELETHNEIINLRDGEIVS